MKIVRLDTGQDWDETTVVEQEVDDLDVAIAELEQLKTARDAAVRRYKQAEDRVLRMLDERGEKSHETPFDGGWVATKVVAERVSIDEQRLQERLGDQLWDHVTVRRFDRRRLENCVSLGIIDGSAVAECSTVEQNAPYLRLTRRREQESEEYDEEPGQLSP